MCLQLERAVLFLALEIFACKLSASIKMDFKKLSAHTYFRFSKKKFSFHKYNLFAFNYVTCFFVLFCFLFFLAWRVFLTPKINIAKYMLQSKTLEFV